MTLVLDFIDKNFDAYNRKARLAPALLTSLPIALVITSLYPDNFALLSSILSLIAWLGGARLLSQLGRDMGKAKQQELYRLWGGKPTTNLLRHRTTQNKVLLSRIHSKLSHLTGEYIPTHNEELANPDFSDTVYDSCVRFLLSKTRDHKRFSLLFEENCNYGFRRNLFGMKPIGITITIVCSSLVSLRLILAIESYSLMLNSSANRLIQYWRVLNSPSLPPLLIPCLLANLSLLSVWLLWIDSSWVKVAANAYAARLIESCENLS